MLKLSLICAGLLAASAPGAVARPSDGTHAIPLHMARGTDVIVVHGRLRPNSDCCTYSFRARAGQILHWTWHGPAARMGLTYPDGDGINPGLPETVRLPQTGAYAFDVSPNLMAEGIYGRFTLTLRISR
jgi:hypothetical protein